MKESSKMKCFNVFALVVLTFGIASCGVTDLSEEPLWSSKKIDDVLFRAKREGISSPDKSSRFKFVLQPEKMRVLRVSGVIRSRDKQKEGPVGPVDFVVEINGQSVARKQLRSSESHATFEYVIDLKKFAGQEVTATFIQKNHDLIGTRSAWKRIVVENRRRVRRRAAAEGPNVLFLMVDTVRADHCSLYGYERQTTPNLDRLAARSLVFDRAISPAAWTLPSIASMLTGRYSIKMRAIDGMGLRLQDVTLAEALLNEGISTMAVSTNPLIGPSHAFDQGFETFILEKWERAATVNRHFSKWLDSAESTQWFAYLHYIDPHDPYDAPAPFGGQFSDKEYRGEFLRSKALNEVSNTVNYGLDPPFSIGEADLDFLRDRYDEEIRYWDSTFGKLMDDLERRGLLEHTIIVVVSDHGEEFADHGKYKHGKHLYQETINVPLLVFLPGSELVGRRTDAVETRLLMSSLLAHLGIKRPVGIRGNLFKLEQGNGVATSYTRYTVRPDNARIRMGLASQIRGQVKLMKDVDRDRDLFFDLELDPLEKEGTNEPTLPSYRHLKYSLDKWLRSHPRATSGRTEISDETLEDLRALGYVQ